jgi:tellurite resistance protein TehA-like permease
MGGGSAAAAARVRRAVAGLHPSYAALVMATGIVSTGLATFGFEILSDIALVVTIVAFAILVVGYTWRGLAYRRRTLAEATDPSRAFGYFCLVAGANVLGLRLALDHDLVATAVLGSASAILWLVFTYAIPGNMIVGARTVLPRINGNWFMWVVATQSIAAVAATLAGSVASVRVSMAVLAVALWGIGVLLYLMLAALVSLRLLDEPVSPHALSPNYWIYMGATAISAFAGARILALPASLPVMMATRQVVSGLSFLLWAFGTWWIPLLVAFGIWRHMVRREHVGYEPALWSMVFPLGMYAVASETYGAVTGLGFMVDIARVAVWVGVAACIGVAGVMGASSLNRGQSNGSSPASPGRPDARMPTPTPRAGLDQP